MYYFYFALVSPFLSEASAQQSAILNMALVFWLIASRPSRHQSSTFISSSISSCSDGIHIFNVSIAFYIISFYPFWISSRKDRTSEVKISILLGPFISLTSTATGPPFAPFAGADAYLLIYSPSLLTYFVILALMLSKVLRMWEGSCLLKSMSQILTAS